MTYASCCVASFVFMLFVQEDKSMRWNYETGLYVWSNLNPFIHSANIWLSLNYVPGTSWGMGIEREQEWQGPCIQGDTIPSSLEEKRDEFICLVWFLSDVGWAGNRHSRRQRRAYTSLRPWMTWSVVLTCPRSRSNHSPVRRGTGPDWGPFSLPRTKGSHFGQETDEQIASPGCTSASDYLSSCLSWWGISQLADQSQIWFLFCFVLLF